MANEKRLDLIDRNALLKKMQNWNTKERLINCVEYAPTVDAVALPCKIGDTLYDIFEAVNNGGDEIKEFKVSKIQIDIVRNGRAFLVVENTLFPFDDFGKTTFLSREEAEAALAKMDGDQGE